VPFTIVKPTDAVRLACSLETDAESSSRQFAAGVATRVNKDSRLATRCTASKNERRTEGLVVEETQKDALRALQPSEKYINGVEQ